MRHTTLPRVLILDSDDASRAPLALTLKAMGYGVSHTSETATALRALHESREAVVVLFNVELPRNRMMGLDQAALIGALLSDRALAARHSYVLTSASAENVSLALGGVLDRLAVPILPLPYDLDVLRELLARATYRLWSEEAAPIEPALSR
jgi:DNA-binding NtrC family response regulator